MIYDISCNIADNMYTGTYNTKQKHQPDIESVLQRSFDNKVIPFFVGTDLASSRKCYSLAQRYNTFCYLGIHPNSATSNRYELSELIEFISSCKVADDNLVFCPNPDSQSKQRLNKLTNLENNVNLQFDPKLDTENKYDLTNSKNGNLVYYPNSDSSNKHDLTNSKNENLVYYPNSDSSNKQDLTNSNNENLQYYPNSDIRNKHELINSKNENLQFYKKEISHVIAIGECGLDYNRPFSTKEDQKHLFTSLLDLPYTRYFIHNRDSHRDLLEILSDYNKKIVIHSFDGTIEEANAYIKKGYYIGINGRSLNEKLDVIKEIDVNYLLIESDAPYCKIKRTADAYKYVSTVFDESKRYDKDKIFKGRNEPVCTVQVLEVLAGVKGMGKGDVEGVIEKNEVEYYGEQVYCDY